MFRVLFVLLVSLLVIALLVILQVWLCKKSIKLGLILPIISLVLSLPTTIFVAFNMVGAGPKNIIVIAVTFCMVYPARADNLRLDFVSDVQIYLLFLPGVAQ